MRTPRQNQRRSARDKRARLMPVWDAAKRKRFWLETARAVRPLWPGFPSLPGGQ